MPFRILKDGAPKINVVVIPPCLLASTCGVSLFPCLGLEVVFRFGCSTVSTLLVVLGEIQVGSGFKPLYYPSANVHAVFFIQTLRFQRMSSMCHCEALT